MQEDHSDYSVVAKYALVLGSSSHVQPNPTEPAKSAKSANIAFQSDQSMRQSGLFLHNSQSLIRWTSGYFLLYFFQVRKLQPSTIDGYSSAIADKLGNSSFNLSKDENLTLLLDSFHRDRAKGRRGIPSWNLYLVLHQLTKAPFEVLKEVSLKHLTLKTVLLFSLGSCRCRSEIHAWQNKNINIKQTDLKYLYTPYLWPLPWITHSSLAGPYAQSEHCATI